MENTSPSEDMKTNIYLETLDHAFYDPFIENVLTSARIYNELLQAEDINEIDVDHMIPELDTNWGNLLKAEVSVTGRIETKDENGGTDVVFVDDEAMVSNGFALVPDSNLNDRARVVHHLLRPDIDDRGSFVYKGCIADIDAVTLSFEVMSVERAKAWLTVFLPELIDEIDTRVFNFKGDDAVAMMALTGFPFSFGECAEDDINTALRCIAIYVNDILHVDVDLPYDCTLDGLGAVQEANGEYILAEVYTENRLLLAHSVQPVLIGKEPTKNIIFVLMRILYATVIVRNQALEYLFPLNLLPQLTHYVQCTIPNN